MREYEILHQELVARLDHIIDLLEESARLTVENAKFKAFWDHSRLVDQMQFEDYYWKDALKEAENNTIQRIRKERDTRTDDLSEALLREKEFE